MQQRRVVDIEKGVAMVVTDLHGEGRVYEFLREKFLALHQAGEVDYLVICGDLIHSYGSPETDASLEMILDVMRLQRELGEDKVILLLGNHELPHIYSISLSKGDLEFTSRFENALAALDQSARASIQRKEVLEFLMSVPFYVRTKAGVLLTHAGASPAVESKATAECILTFDHTRILGTEDDWLANYPTENLRYNPDYMMMSKQYFAIKDFDDPRFLHPLRGMLISQNSGMFRLLWDTLFTTNELDWTLKGYTALAETFLKHISALSPFEQRVIVAGHIGVKKGFAEIGPRQLRIASYTHAYPNTAGCYLLLDCSSPIHTAKNLIRSIHAVFEITKEKPRR